MANGYYTSTGVPTQGSRVTSPGVRAQFAAIEAGFDKLPTLPGTPGVAVVINGAGTGFTTTTGTLTLAGNFTTSGAYAVTLTATGTTSLTLPTSGTLLTTTGNGSSLTGITAGQISGLAAVATSGSASDLGAGTLPTGRLSGSYTGITGVGTITAGTWNGTTIGGGYGGTGNAFFQVTGPTTTVRTFTYPDQSDTVLTAGFTRTVSVGYPLTSYNNGTVSSGTLTPSFANSGLQHYTNNGGHTLAAPSGEGTMLILVTNGASAGSITFSGFSVGSSTGATLTTTSGHKFWISIVRGNSIASYSIAACQ